MESLNDIKKRIKSVNDISQMTHAMQLVSASKMRKSKQQHEMVSPFFTLCAESLMELHANAKDIDNPFLTMREHKIGSTWKIAYFVLTGDQGLAGAYNNNIVKIAEEHIQKKILENAKKSIKMDYKLYVFGHIGGEKLKRDGYAVDPDFSFPISEPTYYEARNVANIIRAKYLSGEFDLVYLIYTKMESAISMKPVITRLVPIDTKSLKDSFASGAEDAGIAVEVGSSVDYYPNPEAVFSFLIDTGLNAVMYGAMVEAFACEQTARMQAMDNANRNADEMMKKLTIESNRARQARITNELNEIVNGASQVE
ncbi:MAG: ATP synthase F1 subunit gamma [Clostridiales bacterium]|nr:ATP synthase F1 subunit gamma [Clostridiales bacterium]